MNTVKEIQKIIHDKIRYKREDTLLNHVKTFLDRDYDNYNGILKGNDFALWKFDHWGGIFYPIIYGHISDSPDVARIYITVKLNFVGFLLSVLMVLGFFIGLLISYKERGLLLGDYFLSMVVTSLLLIAFILGYRHHRKIALAEFDELIKEKAADSQIILN